MGGVLVTADPTTWLPDADRLSPWEGLRVTVAGLGVSGFSAADALVELGATVTVLDALASDEHADKATLLETLGATVRLGEDATTTLPEADLVIVSPGWRPTAPLLVQAADRGVTIWGDVELAWRLQRPDRVVPWLGVTGTNGKTTTTTLTGEILRGAGLPAVVCGNIGLPVLPESLSATDDTWLVTEVSSFQLDTTRDFRPRIAAFLNLTPDHLDRHGTLEGYREAKAKVIRNQGPGDVFVYNADDAAAAALAPRAAAAGARVVPFARAGAPQGAADALYASEGMVFLRWDGAEAPLLPAREIRIPGAHNLENALAAAAMARAAGVEADAIAGTLRRFAGVEHRLELALEKDGVRYVNDSKGTNPDASIKAIEAMPGGIVLIAGGYDKHADFADFLKAGLGRVKALVLIGATADAIEEAARAAGYADIRRARDMAEAVRLGASAATAGDTVLLSPACASWDMYENYEARGRDFKDEVRKAVGGA